MSLAALDAPPAPLSPQRDVQKIRILVIDEHALFREGVIQLITDQPDFGLADHCGSVREGLAVLARTHVDVVLLDVDNGEERGLEFLVRARENGFVGAVLVVTGGLQQTEATVLLAQGAAGLLSKHSSPEELYRSIREALAGRQCIDRRLTSLWRNPVSQPDRRKSLTNRERDALRAVFEGLSNKETAKRLGISESSLKAALQQLFVKTGVRSRSQLIRVALKQYFDQL
jgi:two-component system nitrate/nitrite response regulator NarL